VSLRADDLDDAARRVLSSMLEEVLRLARTVDALLALARADQGVLDLRVEPVDLGVIAGDAVDRLAPLAASRDVTLAARLDPAPAEGDDAWLGRAVDNLIDNAIKFGPAGGTVTVTTGRDGEDVLVSVLDEGPGIPLDARELVFDRFRRLDASRTRATGGTGIGLSIVREIARAHRGRASVQAGPRGGSLFVLAMPGVPDPAPRSPRRSAAVG
jgi:two-component system sensor histidine kinase BaeS